VELLSAPFKARTWRETLYALLALPLGVFWFTLLVVLFATGFGSLIGVPLIAVGLLVARSGASTERSLLGWATGRPIPSPPVVHVPASAPWWQRWRPVLLSWDRLRETGYLLLLLPMGIVLFTVAVTLWTIVVSCLTAPLWSSTILGDDFLWPGNRLDTPLEWVGVLVAAVVLLFVTPWVVHGLVHVQALLANGLLGASRRELEEERDAAVETVSRDRRQIERDLHDGAQNRLVGLAVELGRAREKLEAGASADEALELVRNAHEDAKRALEEVRDLARGIHPAILTDRGLDAALSSIAAKSPVPVFLDSSPDLRAPEAVEAAAYFVVAEALTNVARHSEAARAEVKVGREDGTLVLRVEDDGKGGAAASHGSGLEGLADRVRALGGTFDLVSPEGRGTTLIARIPCG
jgi:signal transduction histidine kinase